MAETEDTRQAEAAVAGQTGISGAFTLTIDLNTLNHLGIGLYSNIPAVISEVVANSYDADATKVEIQIDKTTKTITIIDDGWGMTREDINNKYLKVGYSKRKNEPTVTPKGRHVMGRKGIGKLSLFSIADIIEVQSVKTDPKGVEHRNGFVMDAVKIAEAIESGGETRFHPTPIPPENISLARGTKIILRNLKSDVESTGAFLRRRLARRFSVIGAEYNFTVVVDNNPISIEDRDYFKKVEYLWYIGDEGAKFADYCVNSSHKMSLDGIVDAENGYTITGWVGTFDEQKNIEEGNNTIVVLAWGKLIHEDLLKDIKEGGIYSKYLIGEIRADFLDIDGKEDIATSDRQSLKESDPRFVKLKTYVQDKILKTIQSSWTNLRNADAERKALTNPKVKEWFDGLATDNKKWARLLFGKIESFPIESPEYKKELYKHGILAFETLALKQNLAVLDTISTEQDFEVFRSIFAGMDELEEVHYYQILKGRLGVLKKFEDILPDAKERLIQGHVFDHLWLLDPSWERASTDERIEQSVTTEFQNIDAKLTPDERDGRIDIRYRTAAGRHIIIELKKYDRSVTATELVDQVRKYRRALEKCLQVAYPGKVLEIEAICIIGSPPQPQDEAEMNRNVLAGARARYLTYDELIRQTRDSYRDYLDAQRKISRIQELIDSI